MNAATCADLGGLVDCALWDDAPCDPSGYSGRQTVA
jgi:hypothetical protein